MWERYRCCYVLTPEAKPFMTPNSYLVACAAILALGGTGAAAEKKPNPLTMKLSAQVAVAKKDVIVRARVEPDARSRELIIEWVADDLSGGSHTISLDGARAAATHQYPLKHLAPGQYVVTATLRLMDGTHIKRESTLA